MIPKRKVPASRSASENKKRRFLIVVSERTIPVFLVKLLHRKRLNSIYIIERKCSE